MRTRRLLPVVLLVAAGACRGGAGVPGPDAVAPAQARVPSRYVLVGPAGASVFARPGQPAAGAARLLGGFGYAVAEERTAGGADGGRFLRLEDGRWLAAAEVLPARPSTFSGVAVTSADELRFGWVIVPQATVHAAPTAASLIAGARPMYSRVQLAGPCRRGWCPLASGWIRAADVRLPTLAPRPGAAGPRDRWLDIDLASQTIVAYDGDRPLYATLVSAGVGAPGSPLATPTGVFAVRSKHQLARMDNLEHVDVEPYSYDVPLTQYFVGGKALHAALWHDHFGHPMSHGCVNVAPRDAEWLFAFTTPNLPAGAPEIATSNIHPGTLIRVRGELPARAFNP